MAGQVERQAAFPLFTAHVGNGLAGRKDAGVANQDVDAAKAPHGFRDGLLQFLVLGHIANKAQHARLCVHFLNLGLNIQRRHCCPLRMERHDAGAPNAAGRAGDNGDFAL